MTKHCIYEDNIKRKSYIFFSTKLSQFQNLYTDKIIQFYYAITTILIVSKISFVETTMHFIIRVSK